MSVSNDIFCQRFGANRENVDMPRAASATSQYTIVSDCALTATRSDPSNTACSPLPSTSQNPLTLNDFAVVVAMA
jgi:hypothetical protein